MSYRWRQETVPMTSLLVLQRALDQCGFQLMETSGLIQSLRLARNRISQASNPEEKIAAYDQLVDLIRKCDETNSLPKSIHLDGFTLTLNNFRYAVEGYSNSGSQTQSHAAEASVSKLNNAYKSIAMELENELNEAMASSVDLKMREALIRVVKAERESYNKSVKDAKEKIFQMIQENAVKEGYKVKRNVFKKGKNIGREQYVVVKRS